MIAEGTVRTVESLFPEGHYRVTLDVAEALSLSDDISTISRSYPVDLDPEAHLWRRCMKITEEAGEVFEALAGFLGENPRKGVTHNSASRSVKPSTKGKTRCSTKTDPATRAGASRDRA